MFEAAEPEHRARLQQEFIRLSMDRHAAEAFLRYEQETRQDRMPMELRYD